MRIHLGTDHAAFELKEDLKHRLSDAGYEVVDHGAATYDAEDDYTDFILPTAKAVVAEPDSLGIVLGGSGNGEQIAANKVKGVRAALCFSPELAVLAREHNNANVLSLGGRFVTADEAWEITKTFITTKFTGEARHARRVRKLSAHEEIAFA